MFNCTSCGNTAPSKASPVVIPTAMRDRTYSWTVWNEEDRVKETHTSQGQEIVSEHRLCPACSGIKHEAKKPLDHKPYIGAVVALHDHARKCKKDLSECRLCRQALRTYAQIPAESLSEALDITRLRPNGHGPIRISLADAAVETLFQQGVIIEERKQIGERASKRIQHSFHTAFEVLMDHEKRNKK